MKILKYYSILIELEKELKTPKKFQRKESFEKGYQAGIKYVVNKLKNEV